MLVELRVVDLGIIADLTWCSGPGMTAITGETGAGKTLLVEAIELLVGGRADAASCATAPTRRASKAASSTRDGDEMVLARVVPRDGRSRAYVDGRLATVGELAEPARALVDLHGQHAHQSLLDPPSQRGALDRFAGHAALDASARSATRAPRSATSTPSSRRSAATTAPGPARSTCCATRSTRSTPPRSTTPTRTSRSRPRRRSSPTRSRTARRSTRAYEALDGPALDAVGAALAALDGRAPFADARRRACAARRSSWPTSSRSCAATVERVVDDPQRLADVRAAPPPAPRAGPQVRPDARRRDRVRRRGRGPARRARALRGARRRRSRPARAAPRARRRRRRGRALGRPPRRRRPARHRRGRRTSASWPCPTPRSRSRWSRDRPPTTAPTGHLPARRQPGRARPAARQGRLRRRARPCDAGPARGALGGAADPGVRRGRRRHRRRGRGRGRTPAAGARRDGTRCCASPTSRRWRRSPTQVVVEKAVERGRTGQSARWRTPTVVDGDERVAELSRMLAGVGDSSHARAPRRRAARRPPARRRRGRADGASSGSTAGADDADGPAPPAQAVRRAVRDPGPGARRPAHQGPHPAPPGRARSR